MYFPKNKYFGLFESLTNESYCPRFRTLQSIGNRVVAAGLLLIALSAQAANITWDIAVDYAAASDVRTDGVLVEAFNATGILGAASPVINGVPFAANSTLLDNDATTDFLSGDTRDLAYNQFLNSLDYGSSGTLSIGAGQLEVGKEYLVQASFVDERSSSDARAMQFGDGNGNLSPEVNDQYVTGTFTANGSNQTMIVYGVTSGPHFTGYQLRDLSSAIPTLSTSAGQMVFASFSIDVDFSESVTGLVANDFTKINCSVSNVSGSGSNWTIDVTPTGNGDVQVTLPADAVINVDSHGNVASNTILTTYVAPGSEQPVPTLSTTATDVAGDYTVNVDFSEPVAGLQLGDFAVTSATLSNLSGSGANYSVVVSPNFGGDVTVSLPRNSVIDTDGDALKNVESNELVNAYFITVTVGSPAALLPYLDQDNITATLAAGTYTIDAADVQSTYGTPRFEFWGSNSTYDFTGVTLNFAADIYDDGLSMSHMQIFGNNIVLKNLSMIDLCDKYGSAGKSGGVNLIMDGEKNRVEGFYFEVRGSYPYGYGDCFGKGGPNTIKHWKHSGVLVRGNYNHLLNCTLMQESYGHCIFMQAASNPTIEGCYVQAETRTTDDMLAETSGPAFDIGFLTVWGFTLPGGYTKSTSEAGIRAYNAGNTYINGAWYSRGTSNPTILNNTLVDTRVGVTLTHASGFKYVEGCTTIGTERGYAIGSGVIKNCYSDVKNGPAFGVDYGSNNGVIADITILPHSGANYNGSKHIAYIQGSDHNLTFRSTVQSPEQVLEITVGGDFNHISSSQSVEDNPANDIVIKNLTGYPVILDDDTANIIGQSIGTVTDAGTSNSIMTQNWNVLANLAFLGTATQSSDAYDTLASYATDQNTNGDIADGSVTHTNNEARPWWRIDLEETYDISEIKIWNRTDSNQARLSDYDVTILDENEQLVWTNYQANYPDPSVSLLPNTMGQYVVIQLRGSDPLSLAEVEIFGAVIAGPTGLIANSASGDIVLDWDVVAGASGDYTVKRAITSGGPYITIGTTSGLTFIDTTASDSIYYHYVVTATVNGSETAPSDEVISIIGSAPAKFSVSSGDVSASTFQAGTTNVPANTIDDNPSTRWSAQGDPQWIRYDLGAVKNVHYLKLSWHSGASRWSSFHIEVSDDGAIWTAITVTQQSSGTTTALETVDIPNTLARYVRIVGHGNENNTWNSITEVEIWGTIPAPPVTPTNLAATPGDGEVSLTWSVSPGATQHHLKRSETNGSGYSIIASVAGARHIDKNVINGTHYYYVVSAENGTGESADSAQVISKPFTPIVFEELQLADMTHSSGEMDLSFGSVPGRIYQLQKTDSFSPVDWQSVGDPMTGTGNSITLTDPDADVSTTPQRFYRISIQP
ncbi:MAG: discoidin domain-containing protein [Lentimonas sp.]